MVTLSQEIANFVGLPYFSTIFNYFFEKISETYLKSNVTNQILLKNDDI